MNSTDEWYTVDRIRTDSWLVREAIHRRMYAVTGRDRSFVIDAGIGVGDLRGLVSTLVPDTPTLLLTHSHWDHIGNAAQFGDVRVHPAERSESGGVDVEFTDRPGQFVEDWIADGNSFPDDFDPESYAIQPVTSVTDIQAGDTFDLGDRELRAIHTPGHTDGHIGFLDRSEGILYGGDIVHRNRGLYLQLPRSDLRSCLETLTDLRRRRDAGEFDVLLTAHNPPIEGEELDVLDTLTDGLRAILEGTVEPTPDQTPWGEKHRYEFDGKPVITHP